MNDYVVTVSLLEKREAGVRISSAIIIPAKQTVDVSSRLMYADNGNFAECSRQLCQDNPLELRNWALGFVLIFLVTLLIFDRKETRRKLALSYKFKDLLPLVPGQLVGRGLISEKLESLGDNFSEASGPVSQLCNKPSWRLLDENRGAKLVNVGNLSLVYQMYNKQGDVEAIFKPMDHLQLSHDDDLTKKFKLSTPRECLNEVAAFRIDQLLPLCIRSNVPEVSIEKVSPSIFGGKGNDMISGSLHKFVRNTENAEDYGSALFSVEDIQRIAILDILILNCDRHTGNLLFDKSLKRVYPIDHAIAFAGVSISSDMNYDKSLLLSDVRFDWLTFPQVRQGLSDDFINAISKIDVQGILNVMEDLGMTQAQRIAAFISSSLLQVGVTEYGLSLFQIGSMIQRQGDRSCASQLELLAEEALELFDSSHLPSSGNKKFNAMKQKSLELIHCYLCGEVEGKI